MKDGVSGLDWFVWCSHCSMKKMFRLKVIDKCSRYIEVENLEENGN